MLQHRRIFAFYLIVWLVLTLGMAARVIFRGEGSAATVAAIEDVGLNAVRWFQTSLSVKLSEDGAPPGRFRKWLDDLREQKKGPAEGSAPTMNPAPISQNERSAPDMRSRSSAPAEMRKYAPLAELSPN